MFSSKFHFLHFFFIFFSLHNRTTTLAFLKQIVWLPFFSPDKHLQFPRVKLCFAVGPITTGEMWHFLFTKDTWCHASVCVSNLSFPFHVVHIELCHVCHVMSYRWNLAFLCHKNEIVCFVTNFHALCLCFGFVISFM